MSALSCFFLSSLFLFVFFFFNDTATTEIYTLSLHDALPICRWRSPCRSAWSCRWCRRRTEDRKSTRLNSSHCWISYAVFCLKKKKQYDKKRSGNVNDSILSSTHLSSRLS